MGYNQKHPYIKQVLYILKVKLEELFDKLLNRKDNKDE